MSYSKKFVAEVAVQLYHSIKNRGYSAPGVIGQHLRGLLEERGTVERRYLPRRIEHQRDLDEKLYNRWRLRLFDTGLFNWNITSVKTNISPATVAQLRVSLKDSDVKLRL